MGFFRRKPLVIEAVQFVGPMSILPDWVKGEWFYDEIYVCPVSKNGKLVGEHRRGSPVIRIPTLEGVMEARVGDWIIKGVKGEVYPCKPDIFAAMYETCSPSAAGHHEA
jgi:hypothetical protein